MIPPPRTRRLYGLQQYRILYFYRRVTSSVLDPDVLAAARKIAAEREAKESRQLTTLKIQMPATVRHIGELASLIKGTNGLWNVFSCK